jgi:anti-sigma regulatory factor (Ser/Thr protein kinase)
VGSIVPNPPGGFQHPALVYDGLDDFLRPMTPFVGEGLESGEPVFAAVGPAELGALRAAFDDHAHLSLVDTNRWHPAPGPRLRAFHTLVTDRLRRGARRLRLVGEPVWPEGRPDLLREWARYESVLNEVLAPFPISLVCTYPASRLDPAIVAGAARTHPVLGLGPATRSSTRFEPPASLVARWNPPLQPPPATADRLAGPADPATGRTFVAERAAACGLPRDRVLDAELAASEILTNAIVHGRGEFTLAAWSDGDAFFCEVRDHGPGVGDPLAGYRPPDPTPEGGRGLWLTRQVTDLLRIDSGADGTAVRFRIDREPRRGARRRRR